MSSPKPDQDREKRKADFHSQIKSLSPHALRQWAAELEGDLEHAQLSSEGRADYQLELEVIRELLGED